ncbi:MAG: hypothetical protein CFE45_08660 [Burkholderiales bacterium PBB5]|nr:MAG: hypothetical protein CFE45_08660 [Burkholderiales bacterium PBB5]
MPKPDVTTGISPSELMRLLPGHLLHATDNEELGGAVIQHYRHVPGAASVTAPPLRDHLLVVNLSGHLLIEDARTRGRWERRWAGSGQMSLMPAGKGATRAFKGQSEALLVHLPVDLVQHVALESGFDAESTTLVPRLAVADETVQQLGRLLLETASNPGPGTASMLGLLTRALVLHLLRHHAQGSPEREPAPSSLSGGRLQRVIAHMQLHMDEHLPLSSLIDLSGLSPSQFSRSFRATMGKPPHGYLLELRIERARNLLEKTDLPVTEIGLQCGFGQPTHFATMFRKVVGLSPREWRVARRM